MHKPGVLAQKGTALFSLPRKSGQFPRRAFVGLLLCVACVLTAGCAMYQIGNDTLYPADVSTVHVPVFESVSFRRNLGERLTEAVAKEIELKTPFKVVNDPRADSVLSGRIVGESKRVVVDSRSGDPREFQVNLQVEVSWLDRRGNVLRQCEPIPLPGDLTDVSATGRLVPAVGHSLATAQQDSIQRLAEQIVSLMEAPW